MMFTVGWHLILPWFCELCFTLIWCSQSTGHLILLWCGELYFTLIWCSQLTGHLILLWFGELFFSLIWCSQLAGIWYYRDFVNCVAPRYDVHSRLGIWYYHDLVNCVSSWYDVHTWLAFDITMIWWFVFHPDMMFTVAGHLILPWFGELCFTQIWCLQLTLRFTGDLVTFFTLIWRYDVCSWLGVKFQDSVSWYYGEQ